MFQRVLAGVDGRNRGRDAIALARQLTADDGQLVLAHVYPLRGDPLHRDYDDHEAAEYVHARHLLTAAREQAGVRAELRWTACTSPGRGPVGRLIYRSTARALVQTAHCPLLVLNGSTPAKSAEVSGHDDRALAAI